MISPEAKEEILGFVDQVVPSGTVGIWLCGSRAKGCARPDSDWDVVALHPDAPPDRKDVIYRATQINEAFSNRQDSPARADPSPGGDAGHYCPCCVRTPSALAAAISTRSGISAGLGSGYVRFPVSVRI